LNLLNKKLVVITASALLFGGVWSVFYSDSFSIDAFPIQKVTVNGSFKHVSQQQLKNKIAEHISGGFFSIDVVDIENRVEEMAWVKTASVRRIWPHTIGITIEEQAAVAIWNKKSLLNANGEIFDAVLEKSDMLNDLPRLFGPDKYNALILTEYKKMIKEFDLVGKGIVGKKISVLQMDERHAWRIVLSDGIELRVGRNNIHASLRRFAKVLESSFSGKSADIAHVDLRYTNGFAVKWKPKQVSLSQNDLSQNGIGSFRRNN